MFLVFLITLIFTVLLLYIFWGAFFKCLSWYTSKLLSRWSGLEIQIGSVGFLRLRDIHISVGDDSTAEIELLWVSSRMLSSTCRSFLSICVQDVRVNLSEKDRFLTKQNESSNQQEESAQEKSIRTSSRFMSFLRNVSIHLYNVEVNRNLASEEGRNRVLRFGVSELIAAVRLRRKSVFAANLDVNGGRFSCCRFLQDGKEGEDVVADLTVGVSCNAQFLLHPTLFVKSLVVEIRQPAVVVDHNFNIEEFAGKSLLEPKKTRRELPNDEFDAETYLKHIFSKIPDNASIKISLPKATLDKVNEHGAFDIGAERLECTVGRQDGGNVISGRISVRDFGAKCDQSQLLALDSGELSVHVTNSTDLTVSLNVLSFHASYIQEYVGALTSRYLKKTKTPAAIICSADSGHRNEENMSKLVGYFNVVECIVHIEDTRGTLRLEEGPPFVGALASAEGRAVLRRTSETTVNYELDVVLESGGCTSCESVTPMALTSPKNRKQHSWCTPLSLGFLLVKVDGDECNGNLQCMLSECQVEFTESLLQLVNRLKRSSKRKSGGNTTSSKSLLSSVFPWKPDLTFNATLESFNVFFVNAYNTALVCRSDRVKFEYLLAGSGLNVNVEGSALSTILVEKQPISCVDSKELANKFFYLGDLGILYRSSNKKLSINIEKELSTEWSTTLHMHLFTLVDNIKAALSSEKQTNSPGQVAPPVAEGGTTKEARVNQWNINVCGEVDLSFVVSSCHKISFAFNECQCSIIRGCSRSFKTELLLVNFDDVPIFRFVDMYYVYTFDEALTLAGRKAFTELQLATNKHWSIELSEFLVSFPHEFNFAEAASEDAISTFKWLKRVHGIERKPFTAESPLPADFIIRIKYARIDVADDPFERKLRDNYELLEDEYNESLKRKSVLDSRIQEYKKTHPMVSATKIGDLYNSLAQKNAEIYIKRSRMLHGDESIPPRPLASWKFDDVEIVTMADSSYHGTERCIALMKQLDPITVFLDDGMEFTTLWCRTISCQASSIVCTLRDFPRTFVDFKEFNMWGTLMGAEQEGLQRAKRISVVEVGEPFENANVERSMPPLKFYYNLTWDMDSLVWTYGVCWDPVMAQVNLAMEYINRPSSDPSPALPWWDKVRLLFHGTLVVSAKVLSYIQHASLDQYNKTELLDSTWTDCIIQWTNGKIMMKGDFSMFVHTASRYNATHLLHMPNLKVSSEMRWLCIGNPFDHHSVMPCAPDKIPEYSINQEHDSYRAFRSQNLDLSISFETKTRKDEIPTLLLYGSTLRWLENFKSIISGMPRLTRRGKLFGNTKPRKTQLGRHFHHIQLSLSFHRWRALCWTSLSRRRGFDFTCGRLRLSSQHLLTITTVDDGFIHSLKAAAFRKAHHYLNSYEPRARATWSVEFMNCELSDGADAWLYHSPDDDDDRMLTPTVPSAGKRLYFMSIQRVSYGRETKVQNLLTDEDMEGDTPTHRLVVHGLKGAWTKHNREIVFGLFDAYVSARLLQRNMTTDAMKGFKVESKMGSGTGTRGGKLSSPNQTPNTSISGTAPKLQSCQAMSMLEKLVAEAEANAATVFTEEIEDKEPQQLHGVAACQTNDVVQKNWLIEIINSQMMLRGCETSGYVILSAAKAQILQRLHTPVWKDGTLVSKTTWVGSLDCMQYYATVDGGTSGVGNPIEGGDDVMWLSPENIEERGSLVINDLADLVGSGHSVGGVVSSTVGPTSDPEQEQPRQLQRIISRCSCQFFYASFGENDIDPSTLDEVPPQPVPSDDLWEQEIAVDSFTMTHHDLEVFTNPLQYVMIIDMVNNLLLYVEPRRKEANERLQRMRFQLQLASSDEDPRKPIILLQSKTRELLMCQKRLEHDAYLIKRRLDDAPDDDALWEDLEGVELEINSCKRALRDVSEELALMMNCYREQQAASVVLRRLHSEPQGMDASVVRRAEVCFKRAMWRLTDEDGQLGIADLVLTQFLYSRVTRSDDSVEHLLELGDIQVTNLSPSDVYKEVLKTRRASPEMPLDRRRALRIYCRVRAPVGGISIKEHLEINVVPISIGLTHTLTKRLLKFFFPGRDAEKAVNDDDQGDGASVSSKESARTAKKKKGAAKWDRDDIEKMKERAANNQTFLYIKIPEVSMRLSYKGTKNIQDLTDCHLVMPTIELHNRTITWLDLLIIVRNTAKRVLVTQAIWHKLGKFTTTLNNPTPEDKHEPQDEEVKAALLLGSLVAQDKKAKGGGVLK